MSKKIFISLVFLTLSIVVLSVVVWWYTTRSYISQDSRTSQTLEIPEWWYVDQDGDGISDVDERTYGTSHVESDTDGDGISDKLEIEVYKTDPTNPDTDGDGFPDGLEIIQGYDPLS